MQVSLAGLALLQGFEGCRLTAYQDQGGVWTCGWGATGADIGPGVVWTQDQADARLVVDLSVRAATLSRLLTAPLTANQFSALLDLMYEIGAGAFAGSSALHLANAAALDQVPAHIELWNKSEVGGSLVVNEGMVRRRQAEVILWGLSDDAPVPNFQALV